MPEAAAAAIANVLFDVGAYTAGAYVTFYGATTLEVLSAVASVYSVREQARKAANAQRAAYEASLKDRYVMVRSSTDPRQIVLGRQRVSGPLAYIGSYGANREHLVMIVILAAHEIDAVEQVYFDDELVALDSGGNVQAVNRRDIFSISAATGSFTLTSTPDPSTVVATVSYGTTVLTLTSSVSGDVVSVSGATTGATGTLTISYQPATSPWVTAAAADLTDSITTDGAGTGSVTVANPPVSGSVRVFWGDPSVSYGDAANNAQDVTSYASVSGSTITVTGCPFPSAPLVVQYRDGTVSSRARVKAYLGAAGQTADTDMIANLPGVWTSAHTMTALAYLRVEFDYSTDAFPGGLPNVSATVRGAKLYDPRTTTTAWSENPALMMRYVATSPLLGRLSTSVMNDTVIAAAATVCDTSTAYVVNGQTFTRPLYTAGLTLKTDVRAKDALDDLAKAMAGRWVVVDGMLRVKAGASVTPLQSLDETWLTSGQPVKVTPTAARADAFNVATGKFANEQQDYVVVDFPQVTADAYVTADGAQLPLNIDLNAVTFVGQAQQVVAAQMRDARQGLQLVVLCNMAAYCVEPFDTLNVSLSRFGWVNKLFEVLDVTWTIDAGIQLTLKETDPSIWALGTTFSAVDPAPNTLFPSPFNVPAITGLTAASGTGQLLRQADGTVQTRVQVSWDAITDAFVTESTGGVEVRYGLATLTEDLWQSVMTAGGQSPAFLTGNLRDGQLYLIKARAYNALVNGAWSLPILHQVVGKTAPPSNVTGLMLSALPTAVRFEWDHCTDADYDSTEARLGTVWGSTTMADRLFKAASDSFQWGWPDPGTYHVMFVHWDTSGNMSAAPSPMTLTITAAGIVTGSASWTISTGGTATWSGPSGAPAQWQGSIGAIVIDMPGLNRGASTDVQKNPLAGPVSLGSVAGTIITSSSIGPFERDVDIVSTVTCDFAWVNSSSTMDGPVLNMRQTIQGLPSGSGAVTAAQNGYTAPTPVKGSSGGFTVEFTLHGTLPANQTGIVYLEAWGVLNTGITGSISNIVQLIVVAKS